MGLTHPQWLLLNDLRSGEPLPLIRFIRVLHPSDSSLIRRSGSFRFARGGIPITLTRNAGHFLFFFFFFRLDWVLIGPRGTGRDSSACAESINRGTATILLLINSLPTLLVRTRITGMFVKNANSWLRTWLRNLHFKYVFG